MWIRRLVGVSSAALVCGLGAIGGAAARHAGEVPGIPINAQAYVAEHNINVYGFFTKTGVNCSDFTGAGVPNPAVKFGALTVSSHPENGRAGCLVTATTIEFLKPGKISFQITLSETGAVSGTDTILDTAIVTASHATPHPLGYWIQGIKNAIAHEINAGDGEKRSDHAYAEVQLTAAAQTLDKVEIGLRSANLVGADAPVLSDLARAEKIDESKIRGGRLTKGLALAIALKQESVEALQDLATG